MSISRCKYIMKAFSFYILLIVLMVPFFFPFYWLIMVSLKSEADVTAIPPKFIFTPTFANYMKIFKDPELYRYGLNSLIIAVGASVIGLAFGLTAAFSIAKYKQFRLSMIVLLARIIPGISLLLPWFIMFKRLGIHDTYPALILGHSIITLPLTIWILIGFFEDVPPELVDAALIDGCTNTTAFLRIILPISLPGVIVALILGFVGSWNEFLLSMVLSGPNTRTLPVIAYRQMGIYQIDWGGMAAAAVIITLPVLLLTFAVQRHVVKGLSFGAVKG